MTIPTNRTYKSGSQDGRIRVVVQLLRKPAGHVARYNFIRPDIINSSQAAHSLEVSSVLTSFSKCPSPYIPFRSVTSSSLVTASIIMFPYVYIAFRNIKLSDGSSPGIRPQGIRDGPIARGVGQPGSVPGGRNGRIWFSPRWCWRWGRDGYERRLGGAVTQRGHPGGGNSKTVSRRQ